jgi:hypothetical protein
MWRAYVTWVSYLLFWMRDVEDEEQGAEGWVGKFGEEEGGSRRVKTEVY